MMNVRKVTVLFVLALVLLAMPDRAAFAAGGTCSSPAGVEGDVIYNDDYDVVQYCDGANHWIAMGGSSGGSASVTGNDKEMQFNDGGSTLAGATKVLWDKTAERMTIGSTTASSMANVNVDVVGKTASNSIIVKPAAGLSQPVTGGSGGGIQSMTTVQRDALSSPTIGMVIFNTTAGKMQFFDGTNWFQPASNNVTIGTSSAQAAFDCKTIKAGNSAATDGVYWIDSDGAGGAAAFQVYCDMTTSGGGWTLAMSNNDNSGGLSLTTASIPSGGLTDLTKKGNIDFDLYLNGSREVRWTMGTSAQNLVASVKENGTTMQRHSWTWPGNPCGISSTLSYTWTLVSVDAGFLNNNTTLQASCTGFTATGANTVVNYTTNADGGSGNPAEYFIANGASGYYCCGNAYDGDSMGWNGTYNFQQDKPAFASSTTIPAQIWIR